MDLCGSLLLLLSEPIILVCLLKLRPRLSHDTGVVKLFVETIDFSNEHRRQTARPLSGRNGQTILLAVPLFAAPK